MFEDKLLKVLNLCEKGNNLGEKVTLVGATKTIDADTINRAISLGLKVVAENKAQEFRDKNQLIKGAEQQFIGHLQSNKLKYVVGKVSLIHSVDCFDIAKDIDELCARKGIVQKVLIQINIGNEQTKSGFSVDSAVDSVIELNKLQNIKIVGLMAMLPHTEDAELLALLTRQMRSIYDELIELGLPLSILSVGMSADYEIAIANGSNMIRLGSAIFGKRNYEV